MNEYSPVPILEAVGAHIPIVRMIIDSLLIAMFYTGFTKSRLHSGKITFFAFGGAFFLFQFVLRIIFDNIEFSAPLIRIIALMCVVFVLAFAFYKANIKLHLFLLVSFFAVRELSFFISHSVMRLAESLPLQWLIDAVEAETLYVGDFQTYFEIIMLTGLILQILVYTLIFFISLRKIIQQFLHKVLSNSELLFLLLPCLSGLVLAFIFWTIMHHPSDYEVPMTLVRNRP